MLLQCRLGGKAGKVRVKLQTNSTFRVDERTPEVSREASERAMPNLKVLWPPAREHSQGTYALQHPVQGWGIMNELC